MIGGDKNSLEEGTDARARFLLQKQAVERLDLFVWPKLHSYVQIARAARENQYDVITAQDPFWRGLIAWRLCKKSGARLNLQLHSELAGQSYLKRRLARFLLLRAASVRVVTERAKYEVQRLGARARVSVLPVFIDVGRFNRVIRESHSGKMILWIGRFEAEKDPLRAISVLQEVRGRGIDAKLVLLGQGSLERTLRKAAHGLPVEFAGWQDPIPYLSQADVVLSTSPRESFGASIVEALAAGVPVVSLDVGVAREAGANIAPPEALAREVMRMLAPGSHGLLRLALLSREEWIRAWTESLS
jgi:glycosyltransferase involved in cell wall biosynthesis